MSSETNSSADIGKNLPAHLQRLNPPQLEAVTHFEGPILVLAGAGSGKTRILTRRVVSLVLDRGVRPRNILAVTFTNKATEEMRNRLAELLGERARDLWVATFHSTALRMLRQHAKLLGYTSNFVVYDDQDSKGVLKNVIKELGLDDKKYPVDGFARAIDGAKNAFLSPEHYADKVVGVRGKIEADVYSLYQQALHKANAMDFGDLLFNAVVILQRFPDVLAMYRHFLHFILVDEFQDTNEVQYTFIKLLAEPRKNLLVVGDDDQSIYAFRGATIRNILEFEKDFPTAKVVKLEQNYRSTANVLEVANDVIAKNKRRKPKRLWTDSDRGDPVFTYIADDDDAEAHFVARQIKSYLDGGGQPKDIAIFYRTNAQSRAMEEALTLNGIPYRIFGGLKFYDRKEIKDILAYLRVLMNEADTQSFLRIVNTPPRGIGPQTVQVIVDQANQSGSTLLEAARVVASRSKGVAEFVGLMQHLKEVLHSTAPAQLIEELLKRTQYTKKLTESSDPAAESRLENINELKAIATFMQAAGESPEDALRTMLDRIALTAGSDLPSHNASDGVNPEKKDQNAVSLMTLHLAKGLEFPLVFLTGLEEGLIPHSRSIDEPNGIEEERRLCYVGITRAMKTLYITRSVMRGMFAAGGGTGFRVVSRFAKDMPEHCLNHLSGPFATAGYDGGFELDPIDEAGWGSSRSSKSFSPGTRNNTWWGQQQERDESNKGSAGKQLIRSKLDAMSALVKPADLFGGASSAATKLGKGEPPPLQPLGPPVRPEELNIGVAVKHPSFGNGEVIGLEADAAGDPGKMKVTIKFSESSEAKKLILKFAKLSLA